MGARLNRVRILRAGYLACAATGAIVAGCTPSPAPVENKGYVLCNSTGCGDNAIIVIDRNK